MVTATSTRDGRSNVRTVVARWVLTAELTLRTAAHPEVGIYTLTAGTYWVLVEDFGGDAAGTTLNIQVRRTS